MAFRLRGWLALGSTVGVVVVACGDDTVAQRTPAKLAQGCTLNSECATPLICAFQICHTACNESRDCPPGQRCVAGNGNKNVCLLPDEEECVSDAGCHGDQVCAEDQECRDPCTDEDQCIGDQVCSTSGACADPDEVDDEGNLPQAGSGGTGGSAGGGGKGGTGGDAAMGGESGEASGGRTGGTSGNGGDAGQGEGAEGGTGGTSGNGGTAGANAGTGGTAGSSAGNGGTAGGSAGTSGTAGATGAGCIRELFGDYAVRNDGALLYEGDPERRIVDSTTALPLTGVVSVLTGANHGCAARTDGSAWCWPINSSGDTYGQLGDEVAVSTVLFGAVQVRRAGDGAYLTEVTSIASGSPYSLNTSCAVSAGTVWCWGDTSDLLNNGAAQQSQVATQVTTNGTTPLTGVKAVSISWGHACALLDTGAADEVWCWGDNDSAEAGTGALGRVQYPTKVVGLVDPRVVSITAETSMVLDGDRVKCWGRNAYEECGVNNNTNPQYTPILVKLQDGMPFDGAVTIDTTGSETCALRNDQTIWCWGYYFEPYAAAYPTASPATGVVSAAVGSNSLARYLTTDGMLHIGTTERSPDCGPLE